MVAAALGACEGGAALPPERPIGHADAGATMGDALAADDDAGRPPSDGALRPEPDAPNTEVDARGSQPDGGTGPSDASDRDEDAGASTSDAGTTATDSGPREGDAGVPLRDSGADERDAAVRPDARGPTPDAGGPCDGHDCGPGVCVALGGPPSCTCPRGYTGPRCGSCADGFIPVTRDGVTRCENVLPVADRRLVGQYDAAAPGTITLIDTHRVSAWNASAGDGVYWPNGASQRPHYILLPPAVRFSEGLYLSSSSFTLRVGREYAVFVVASWDPDGTNQSILDSLFPGDDTVVDAYSLQAIDADTVRWRHRARPDAAPAAVTSHAFDASAGRQLIVVRRVALGSSYAISLSNGETTVTAESMGDSFSTSPMSYLGRCIGNGIGEYCSLTGDVNELVFYEGAMTTAQVDSVVRYLRAKWDL